MQEIRRIDGLLAFRVAKLMANAMARVIIQMVMAGELDQKLGIAILDRVEAEVQQLGQRLLSDEAARLLNHPC